MQGAAISRAARAGAWAHATRTGCVGYNRHKQSTARVKQARKQDARPISHSAGWADIPPRH